MNLMGERNRRRSKFRNWGWNSKTRSWRRRSSRNCTSLLWEQVEVSPTTVVLIQAILCTNMARLRIQGSLRHGEKEKILGDTLHHKCWLSRQHNRVRSHLLMFSQHRTRNFLLHSTNPKQKTFESHLAESAEVHARGLLHTGTPENARALDKVNAKAKWMRTNKCFSKAHRPLAARTTTARLRSHSNQQNSNKELSPTTKIIKWSTSAAWADTDNTNQTNRRLKERITIVKQKTWAAPERAW